jgi:hypothetical protein
LEDLNGGEQQKLAKSSSIFEGGGEGEGQNSSNSTESISVLNKIVWSSSPARPKRLCGASSSTNLGDSLNRVSYAPKKYLKKNERWFSFTFSLFDPFPEKKGLEVCEEWDIPTLGLGQYKSSWSNELKGFVELGSMFG